MIAILMTLLTQTLVAAIETFQITNQTTKSIPLKKVCEQTLNGPSLIEEALSPTLVDCMGKMVNGTSYCQSKHPDSKTLLRGVIDLHQKVLNCQFGSSLLITYACDNKEQLCGNSKAGCSKLKKAFSPNFDLHHAGQIFSASNKQALQCIFTSPAQDLTSLSL